MSIRLRCVHCGALLRLRPELAGRKVRCPQPDCRGEFRVPAAECVASAEEAPSRPAEPPRPAPLPPRSRLPGGRRVTRKRSSGGERSWWKLASAALATLLLGVLGVWRPWSGEGVSSGPVLAATPVSLEAPPLSQVEPFFRKYCLDCHSGEEAEAGFALDRLIATDDVSGQRRRWERVFKLVSVGNMPPPDMDQPPQEERQRVIDWLDRRLYYVDCSQPVDPGRVTVRRLNRNEYNHTIRDLIGVDFEPGAGFPTDDVGYGFDNIGDVLTVPPLLIEKYLSAAEEITSRAILTGDPQKFSEVVTAKEMRTDGSVRDGDDNGQVFVSRGTISRKFTFPRRGEYLITIDAAADQAGKDPAKMALSIDGQEKTVFEIKGDRDRGFYEKQLTIDGDRRLVEISFINDFYEEGAGDRNLYVYTLGVTGPLGLPDPLPEPHRRLVANRPAGKVTLEEAARKNLEPLLQRAFRRPVDPQEVAPYVNFVKQAADRGDSFEEGMRIAVQAVLVSPQFLFRVERQGSPQWNGRAEPIGQYELASRLSYFLWSSMPDDELLELAREQRLHDDAVLKRQVERMLKDPKSHALVENFAGQWLALRKLGTNEVAPDPAVYPEFNEQLRRDMWRETELFFAGIIRDDRPITELLTGRYSYLNARLARFYGVGGPQGEEFERVELAGGRRSGILTHGSVLTLTSYPDRTSPVKRGEWVMSNLLGDAPPEPPPVVPALDETRHAHPDLSLREQLVLHRADPGCASCHKVMDEIGFGLENFDAIGRWREQEGKHPIDAVGVLPSGEKFNGPEELVAILAAREEEFARCLAEKLLTYALGRGLEYYDRCAIDRIVGEVRSHGDRFSALAHAIVTSNPFRMRRAGQ